ncbi:hypothetical protein CPB86DRAFT_793398 [Serendipita vermifera]|nr:hypothetical protein CPB86DRAFT_793398 [Serendipita vermifera]
MNEYKYGRFVQDYVFLEEMGRRVSEWGKDIQKKHLVETMSGNAGVNGRRQMRGGGGGLGANHQRYGARGTKHAKTKREVLQEKLEELDIEMMFLPDGMNRRKVNQSTFDNKSNKGFLTIGFRLHRPGSRKAPSASVLSLAQGSNALKKQTREGGASTGSFTLLSHRNELQTPLKDCLARAFQSKSKKEETPLWIQDLIQIEGVTTTTKEDDANRTDHDRPATLPPPYQILISGPPMFHKTGINSSASVKRNFVALDKDATLVDALRTHTFVEFPTLEVISEKDAEHIITRKDNLVEDEDDEWELFARKRRLYDEEDEESGEDGSGGSSMNSSDEDEQEEEERAQEARRKRRKIDVEAGKNLINSLMAYGDEESEEDDGDENGNGTAPTAASSSSVQPNGANAASKGLGVLQMLDYESDKSSEGEEEGEEEDTKVASNAFLAPVSGWGEDREMVDWGDD